jgi:hypothetical protein
VGTVKVFIFMVMRIDVTGQRFGRRTAIKDVGRNNLGQVLWLARCDCGREDKVISTVLKRTNCCRDCQMKPFRKHGDYNARLYKIWRGMLQRCYNSKSQAYKHYGSRGIGVCDDWQTYEDFKKWSLSNGYKDTLTIDRKDYDGDYCPSNCQWITIQEQNVAGKKRVRSDNTSGEQGVYYRKDTDQWFAGIGVGKKFIRSRCYNTKAEAVAERERMLTLSTQL